jgi:C4-dicarboxylate-specific signal transduction histidine kinase
LKRRAGRSPHGTSARRRAPARSAVQTHLKILHTVAEAVSRTLDVDEVVRTAVEALTGVTGHEISSLHLLSDDGKTLELRGERGMSPRLREVNRSLPVGEGLIGHVATSGKTVRVDRNYEDPNVLPSARAAVRRDQIHGFVCVPIHSRGRVLGTLSLGRKTLDQFDQQELALLEAAADQIGVALDNARLYSELRRERDEIQRAHAQRIRAETQLIHAEKLSAVGELASGVAHEINNPLTTILGLTHLLLTHPETTSHVRDRLGIVAEEAGRAARIVQNLLLFARHYTPERRPCSLADQARRVLELIGYQLQQDNIRVVTDFAACPFVWADENQLQQVLLNLVQNAHQAMATHPANRVLTVRVWPSDRHAYVEVRDTGPGIPPEVLPRVFDPFFTTKPPGEGSGLGLSVSYGIVTELGGSLRAENAADGGASFIIRLPLGELTA